MQCSIDLEFIEAHMHIRCEHPSVINMTRLLGKRAKDSKMVSGK